jgi:hypothetical protein
LATLLVSVSDAPNEFVKVMFWPADVAWKAASRALKAGPTTE